MHCIVNYYTYIQYSYTFDVGGIFCVLLLQENLLYPVLNQWGTDNYDSLINSYWDFGFDYVKFEYIVKSPDFSTLYCDCSILTPEMLKSCGKLILLLLFT